MTNSIHAAVEQLCQLAPDWFRYEDRRGVFPAWYAIRYVSAHTAKHTWHAIVFEDGSPYPNSDTQCIRLIVTLLALCDSRGWSSAVIFHPQLEPDLRGQATVSSGGGFQHRCAASRIEALIACVVGKLSASTGGTPQPSLEQPILKGAPSR